MSLKRSVLEGFIGLLSKLYPKSKGQRPNKIFVLRNNDIGDLLVSTPIFEALKKAHPEAYIIAGVGSWNTPILEGNPFVDEILPINAPWHNKQTCRTLHNSFFGLLHSLCYIYTSAEVKTLKTAHCDTGIDILGSPEGSLLMMRAHIPDRIGVKGYAGGHSACTKTLPFDPSRHVSASAIALAELLTEPHQKPITTEPRPQLYLSEAEIHQAETIWKKYAEGKHARRILIGIGGGLKDKCWPASHFAELVQQIATQGAYTFLSIGTQDECRSASLLDTVTKHHTNLCGHTSLRESFALCAKADLVLCNPSMLMHVAAAFHRPTAVMLGASFHSAKEHDKLWGYPDTCITFGPEPTSPAITSPEAVLNTLTQKHWL
tara:strand:+ start:1301 stop:2425 length:1125 start_codon:yes stop_codon:yes gene_type:complete